MKRGSKASWLFIIIAFLCFSSCNPSPDFTAKEPGDNQSTVQGENQTQAAKNAELTSTVSNMLTGTYTNNEYGFSIRYPGTWKKSDSAAIDNILFTASGQSGGPDDGQQITIRVVDNYKDLMRKWWLKQSGKRLIVSYVPENFTLADNKTKGILYIYTCRLINSTQEVSTLFTGFYVNNVYVIAQISGPHFDESREKQWREIAGTLTPLPAAGAITPPKSESGTKPVTLRYDYLQNEADDTFFNQLAVQHSYSHWEGVSHSTFDEGPIIILPRKGGIFSMYLSSPSSKVAYNLSVYLYPNDQLNEKELLSEPGWGLATRFHPENMPFTLQNIRISAVANHTSGVGDYSNHYVRIRVLNQNCETLWSQDYPWSCFRNTEAYGTEEEPKAIWRDIPVDNLTVNGDFTVEIIANSDEYDKRYKAYNYFAVNYERISSCGDTKYNSFISENGRRADPWLTLVDHLDAPVCFNLCIRVDGLQ